MPSNPNTRVCSIDECVKPSVARGWCWMHYARFRRHGDPEFSSRKQFEPGAICSVSGCDLAQSSGGYCGGHYRSWKIYGDPLRAYRVSGGETFKFWQRVDKSGDCWEWQGNITTAGYGQFSHKARRRYAHRVSYEWAFGDIPVGMFVCHHCDNPACVRPDHLFLGTQADNMRDRDSKGRRVASDLTADDIRTIRRLYAGGSVTQKELAQRFGVTGGTMNRIIKRHLYRWVEDSC